jgi:hypothetical protein
MSREISGFFALILDAASAREVMYVSEVVDIFLAPYLLSQSLLAKSLRDYLPRRHQSWKYFLDRMEFNDEEKVLFGFNCDPLPEDSLQLLKACESLIEDFNSRYLATVVSKIRGREKGVSRFPEGHREVDVFSVPYNHTEVDVFYATDRHVTEDGEYIGQHSAMSDWRGGKELHYGITTVGIPDERAPTRMTVGIPDERAPIPMTVGIPDERAPTRMKSPTSDHPLKHVEILSIDTTLQHENRGFVKKINDELVAQACTSIH